LECAQHLFFRKLFHFKFVNNITLIYLKKIDFEVGNFLAFYIAFGYNIFCAFSKGDFESEGDKKFANFFNIWPHYLWFGLPSVSRWAGCPLGKDLRRKRF